MDKEQDEPMHETALDAREIAARALGEIHEHKSEVAKAAILGEMASVVDAEMVDACVAVVVAKMRLDVFIRSTENPTELLRTLMLATQQAEIATRGGMDEAGYRALVFDDAKVAAVAGRMDAVMNGVEDDCDCPACTRRRLRELEAAIPKPPSNTKH